jgi:hypothetical protein
MAWTAPAAAITMDGRVGLKPPLFLDQMIAKAQD